MDNPRLATHPNHTQYFIRSHTVCKATGSTYRGIYFSPQITEDSWNSTAESRWYLKVACLNMEAPTQWYGNQNNILVKILELHAPNSFTCSTTVGDYDPSTAVYIIPRTLDDTTDTYIHKEFDYGNAFDLGIEVANPQLFNGGTFTMELSANTETGGGSFDLPGDDELDLTFCLTKVDYQH